MSRVVAMLLLLAAPWACTLKASPEQVCDRALKEDCFDADEARRCSDRFEAIEQRAEEQGCGEAGDAYLRCMDDVIEQTDGCKNPEPFKACDDELAAAQCGP